MRRSSHFGPANRIFSDEIVIVYGTNDKKFEEVEKKVAIFIANELFKTNELSVKIISDKEFINNAANPDVYPGNLIIIGGSITNALANRVINQEFMTGIYFSLFLLFLIALLYYYYYYFYYYYLFSLFI